MRRMLPVVAPLVCGAMFLTACSGGPAGNGGGGGDSSSDAPVVDGGTFTMALAGDPGSLDPQASAGSGLFQLTQFAYDNLLSVDEEGTITSQLATEWSAEGTSVDLTLAEGVTCGDGGDFTVEDVVANIEFVADPENASPFLGTFLPPGTTAEADVEAGTVRLTTASEAPFVLNGLANLPMVCAAGLEDRDSLTERSNGTGPYQLDEVVPGDRYTYTLREGYTWGPDGAGTDTDGLPDSIVVRVVENESTAANLLLSGEINAATILGPDLDRIAQADLFAVENTALAAEMWFNHDAGRVTSDIAVRQALLQALDLDELREVVTSGRGAAPTGFAVAPPAACPGDSISGALPDPDLAAAGAALDAAGWTAGADGVRTKDGEPLAVTLVSDATLGSGGSAGNELIADVWGELGVDVSTNAQNENKLLQTLYGAGDFDVAVLALNVSSPDQAVPFFSGATPPDGNNFARVENADYDAAVKEASAIPGVDGCPAWLEAESILVRDADVVPFANTVLTTFGSGARFEFLGNLIPTSLRMTGS